MKLLELIVKNVKREDIMGLANFFVQDWGVENGVALSFTKKPNNSDSDTEWKGLGYLISGVMEIGSMSEDASTKIVTREELMRAYDLVEQGYTLWFGGDCPLDFGDEVKVVFSMGHAGSDLVASQYDWSHEGSDMDIIAYKLVEGFLSPTPLEEDFFDEKLSLPTYYCEDNLQDTTLDVWTSQSGDLCVNLTSLGVNNEIVMSPITALKFANDLTTLALKFMEKEND